MKSSFIYKQAYHSHCITIVYHNKAKHKLLKLPTVSSIFMNGLFISGIEFTRQGIYSHLWVYSIRVHSILTTYQLIVMAPPCMIQYRLIIVFHPILPHYTNTCFLYGVINKITKIYSILLTTISRFYAQQKIRLSKNCFLDRFY